MIIVATGYAGYFLSLDHRLYPGIVISLQVIDISRFRQGIKQVLSYNYSLLVNKNIIRARKN
jgi:hypothetical protein